jgi:predicted DNA-binding ribbon-helix-helix protein
VGRKRNTRDGRDLIVTSVRMERETWRRFCEIAERDHRSASQQMRRLVERVVEEDEQP